MGLNLVQVSPLLTLQCLAVFLFIAGSLLSVYYKQRGSNLLPFCLVANSSLESNEQGWVLAETDLGL